MFRLLRCDLFLKPNGEKGGVQIYILQSDNLPCVQRTPVQFSPGCQEGRKEGGGEETFKNKKGGKREQEKFFNNMLSK